MKNEDLAKATNISCHSGHKWYQRKFNLAVIMTLMLSLIFYQCKKDDFLGETEEFCPEVFSVDPINGDTNVFTGKNIHVEFTKIMDTTTINESTFLVYDGSNKVQGNVVAKGSKATFNPSGALKENTVYTGTITTGARDPQRNALKENYVWTFSTGINPTHPVVISTDPANNATNVALGKTVTATFSEPMNPATITNATFSIKQGVNPVTGVVSYSGTTASFNPTSDFETGKTYTATITTGAQNSSGTDLANKYVWNFSTGATVAPVVISTNPADNATNVALGKTVTAGFSQAMNPATITNATFTIKEGINPIAGAVSYSGTTATFNPTNDFVAGKTYTATITTGAENTTGTGLAGNYVWTFSTGASVAPVVISTDPNNNAAKVALGKTVTAVFNQAMNPLTINSSTFTLKEGLNNITGVVSYSGTTASFNPSVDFVAGKTYTAIITTGAENTSGMGLANNYVWSFSTDAAKSVVDMKTAADFGILAGTGISNNAGFSEIRNMNVGISPGTRTGVTGFPPAIVVNGSIHASDDLLPSGIAALLTQAKKDLSDAYLFAEGATTPAPASVSGDQGGKTLAPGIYKSSSTLLIQSGDLTLDAQGDANATWIFQVASDFTTIGGAGGNVILKGGAQAKNVFWQVGSSATIGDNTSFKGNVLAYTSITMNSGAVAEGRMLAINGAVVMTDTNIITKP